MKNIRLVITALMAAIFLSGCGGENGSQTDYTVESSNAVTIAPIPLYSGTQESCLIQEDDNYLYYCGSCRISKIDKSTGAETVLWENAKEAAAREEYLYSRGAGLLLDDRIYFIEISYDSSDNMQRALSTVCTDGSGYERIAELEYSASDIMRLQNGTLYVDDMDRVTWYQVYEDGLLSAPDEQELDYFEKIYYTDNGERVLFQTQALEEFGCYMEQSDGGIVFSVNPDTGEKLSVPGLTFFEGYNSKYVLCAEYVEGMSLKLVEREGVAEQELFQWDELFDILYMDEEYVYVKINMYEEEQSIHSYERISLKDGNREVLFVLKPSELSFYYGGELMDVVVRNGYIYYVDEQEYSFYRMRRSLDAPENVEILGAPVYETGIGFVGSIQSYHQETYSERNPEQLLYTVDLTWLAVDDKFPGSNLINTYLNAHQEANMSYAREHAEEMIEENYDFVTGSDLSSIFSRFSYFDNHYISFVQQEYEYQSGAAHGMPWWIGFTFDLETGERLLLSDLLYNSEEELKEIVSRYFAEMIHAEPENFWQDAVSYVEEAINYESDFYLTEEGMVFYFGPYELACYAAGFQEVTVPYEEFDMRIILENTVK